LKYVCDSDPVKLSSIQKAYPQTTLVERLDPVLQDPEVNGIVIASSAASHYSLARQGLMADKDLLVEKPMALSLREAEEMLEMARERNRILMVGHLLLYHPVVDRLKEMVRSGELGEIYYIYTQRVNLGVIRQDENALLSFAPHDLSVILHLVEEQPVRVSAHGASYIQKEIEDVVFVSLRFSGGKMANIHLSWLDPHKMRKITIVGSKKMVVFDDVEASEKLKIYDKGVRSPSYDTYGEYLTLRFGDITIPTIKMVEPLRTEANHFIQCIETRKEPKTGGQDGVRVVKILSAAQRSLKEGGAPVALSGD
jgi:predicted dehydrogenase